MNPFRKIENFIRTKYEAKRWVMEGGIPDPSTLSEGDDDVVSLGDHAPNIVSRTSTDPTSLLRLSRKKRRLSAPPLSELHLLPSLRADKPPLISLPMMMI